MLFLGPLPPPVHGFSSINLAMLCRLQNVTQVHVFDRGTADAQENTVLNKLWQHLVLIVNFSLAAARDRSALYVGLSGGKGQLLDLPFLLIARLLKIPIFMHHHSFAYLNERSVLAGVCFSIADATHIVLCETMRDALQRSYDICESRTRVLSNLAFSKDRQEPLSAYQQQAENFITIGFISNITRDKGIFEFFEMTRKLEAAGLPAKFLIAGPVDQSMASEFSREISACPNATHLGPVYGVDKTNFFDSIDLLVFPTKYANEAEPLSIHEAHEHGIFVLAADRGCIRSMLSNKLLGQTAEISHISEQVLLVARKILEMSTETRAGSRRDIRELTARAICDNKLALAAIVGEITNLKVAPIS